MTLNIEHSFELSKQKEIAFFVLAERFRVESDTAEIKRLGDEVGLFIFGGLSHGDAEA